MASNLCYNVFGDNMDSIIIGSHVSFTKDTQLVGSVKEALSYGANTFMFYTGAPQNTNRVPLNEKNILEAKELMKKNNIDINNVVIHAPYIINPANKANQEFGSSFLKQEIERADLIGINKIVLHPGSHVGAGFDEGINNIIDTLNMALKENQKAIICLETMAGKGSECGITFEQIKKIIDGIELKSKIGVCLDTCHIHDAGYDLNDFDKILDEFDKVIGINFLKCLHINDSKNEKSSHKDRHENIGFGYIGDNLIKVIYNSRLKGIPMLLETPYISKDDDDKAKVFAPYKQEIEMIRHKKFNPNLIEDIREFYK